MKKLLHYIALATLFNSTVQANQPVPIRDIDFQDINTQLSIIKQGGLNDELTLEILSSRLGADLIHVTDETEKQRALWYEIKPEFDRHLEIANDFPSYIDIPVQGLPTFLENSSYYQIKRHIAQDVSGLEIDKMRTKRLFSRDHPISVDVKDSFIEIIKHCRKSACKNIMAMSSRIIPDNESFHIAIDEIDLERSQNKKPSYVLMATIETDGLVKTKRIPSIMGHFINGKIVNLRLLKKE